jgi:hypothetical protein
MANRPWEDPPMTFDLFVWASPRELDDEQAASLVGNWQAAGGDPATSPFEPSTDVGWFHRELMKDAPWLDVSSDVVPNPSTRPIVLATTDEPPARVVAIRLSPRSTDHELNEIASLAAKYDLVLFDARTGRVHRPLEEMAAYASATFWPAGAIQAAVAGAAGLAIAVIAWLVAIPVISWIAILVGGFLFVMAVFTFVHEGRKALRARRIGGSPPE